MKTTSPSSPVVLAALGDVLGLLLDLVGGVVALLGEPLGELQDAVQLLVVRLHGGEERLEPLDLLLGLLQVSLRVSGDGWLVDDIREERGP